jgi:uncharacterized protein
MPKASLLLLSLALALPLGCGDDVSDDALDSFSESDAAADGDKPSKSAGRSGGSAGTAGAKSQPTRDAAVGGEDKPGAPRDAGASDDRDAGPASADKVSKPGEYTGYGDKLYDGYVLSSEYVAVTDGTLLAVDLYRPKGADGAATADKLPVLWMHSPYNRRYFSYGGMRALSGEAYPGAAARLVDYGYVVAIVDFRGLYASFGENLAYNRGEWIDAASHDAYDITQWLAEQPWSNGQIGMWGCSATGGSQLQAVTTAPPALKAVFPMSCEFDAYPFGVPGGMAPAQGDTRAPPNTVAPAMRDQIAEPVDADKDRSQLQEAFASHGPDRDNLGYVPFRDSVVEGVTEPWWTKSSPSTYLDRLNASGVAMYLAANWDEAATKYGAFFTFNNLTSPRKLIVGPATHCAWPTVQMLTGFDITVEERRFFDHYLKGIDNGVMDEPAVYYYTYGKPKGEEWSASRTWPLAEEKRVPYYLGAGSLVREAPTEQSAQDDFVVNYEASAATAASSGLVYETPALDKPMQVTGHPVVELWLASSGADSDVVAYLQNVAPDGTTTSYNMHGRLRASQRAESAAPYDNLDLPWHPFRASDAAPLVPGEPVQLRFDLLPISMVFEAGHKLRLILTFADAVTPRLEPVPSVSVYRDAQHPSTITLPVITP